MKRIVFYSWQSDLPNASNRGFIQSALEIATKAIAADESIAVQPVVDRDTQGVAGSPDIAATIFGKIASADILVADISIIQKPRKGRATPNPNVLIELGYALRSMGPDRVLLVFNEAYGEIQDLPFDLRMRRLITFNMPEVIEERASERRALSQKLEMAVRTALGNTLALTDLKPDTFLEAVEAIENNTPKRLLLIRRSCEALVERLTSGQPKLFRDGGTTEDLITAISKTQELVGDITRLFDTLAAMNDEAAMLEIHKWLGKLTSRFDLPPGFSGAFNSADFDYYKFIGNEVFVCLVASLLKENRWALLDRLLKEPLVVYDRRSEGLKNGDWGEFSDYLPALDDESRKRNRLSFHADILKERHGAGGGLASLVPFEDYIAADFFLYLTARVSGNTHWTPWTVVFMQGPPYFLIAAERLTVATDLVNIMSARDVLEFRAKIKTAIEDMRKIFPSGYIRTGIDLRTLDSIGTK